MWIGNSVFYMIDLVAVFSHFHNVFEEGSSTNLFVEVFDLFSKDFEIILAWDLLLGEFGFGFDDDDFDLFILTQQIRYYLAFGHEEPALLDCTNRKLFLGPLMLGQLKINIQRPIGQISHCGIRPNGSDKIIVLIGNDLESQILPLILPPVLLLYVLIVHFGIVGVFIIKINLSLYMKYQIRIIIKENR